ncbi:MULTISPECIES: transporter substrate-binding domain-containing protein [Silvimonas]|uniref:transporter substrate-binding domain-containing protein n=1 Tax=Silvimonas TaxID=300264 RepID=UPI0024B3993B|nr:MULTISPECIES: transporter substrate-binding domain-containing protein [Silvimonas]MDR3427113.1 transporter substrate-binding domain-containing protein [Silvimonas sp.]
MNMRHLLIASILGLTALSATAADLLDTVKQRGTLKVALEGTYPPFNYKDNGQLTGFDVEIASALAQKLGVKAEFTTTEWSGILAGLQAGKYDVIVNQVGITPKRLEAFDFSDPYVISEAQLVVRKNETRQFKSLNDLKGAKLGVGQGTNYADMARAVAGVDVKTYPGEQEYLQDLALGRVDAALNDTLMIPYLIKQTKLPLKAGAPVGDPSSNGIPFAKNNPKFKAALNKALADIKADGTYGKISQKYFGRDVSKAPTIQ